ncbi:MAG: serine--tRNA ligase [Lentisphaeria bacterium]|nr:serine--tRNA ligase [Lentisphaerota bacterium]MBO5695488.1 serine--tRNA ligase [Lentisphaeria bacterium]
MLDIKLLRDNPDLIRENIRKKFQDHKLPMVDEAIELDKRNRTIKTEVQALLAKRNAASKQIGMLMKQGKKDEAEAVKQEVANDGAQIEKLSEEEANVEAALTKIMMVLPNIIDASVPIGKSDAENVEVQRYGEPVVPDFEIPYHTEIMESFCGIDLDSARRVAGNGFYYLMGDIARLHSAILSYARDFMIERGFTYCIPPFMIRSSVVSGVMSFAEMESMMYKIEGEDLFLIGTSEHSMIGKFIDQIIPEEQLPITLTSYSPCFRKEKGAHGIEERGVYRIHQFEKQEMIVICKPEESMAWFDKLWQNTVDLFRSMDIPVRTLECCSGDLADLKVKSVDVEAWSPRQQKYFEVGSCSTLGDAQARRLKIRVNGADKSKYYAHTLNNTVVAPPRMLIAFLENHLQADGSVTIPEVLRPYCKLEKLVPNKK